ncbi:hypothetical protein ABT173_25560 [Streptomyces sp. NPDC001795]|uniref:hypothetical protein n=1 Tax=Streptomyces sp. NPDC001795 TaxID=3154525 RepID=UPI0033280FC6
MTAGTRDAQLRIAAQRRATSGSATSASNCAKWAPRSMSGAATVGPRGTVACG